MEYLNQKKQRRNWPDWIHESLKVLKPPEKLTVSQWAEKHRILDSKTSAEPGPWKNSRTPYLVGIMDAFNDPDIEEVIFMKSTQVGGTECINNIVGYIIDQDQSSTLYVLPTIELAKFCSENRIQPMVNLCSTLKKHYREDQSKDLELQFDGMFLCFSGANSAASLASRPCKNVLFDETDKFPSNAGKEADPISLGKERSGTFMSKKSFLASTPTTEYGIIYQAYKNANTQYHYFVCCPFCGYYQVLKFAQVKWPKGGSEEDITNHTYYECEKCKEAIRDCHKQQMLLSGEWRAVKNEGKRSVAFHINALYSPWKRFSDVAIQFKRAYENPDLLMNVINSWFAEPWVDKELELTNNIVFERQSEYEEMIVPDGAELITAGVDVQKDRLYYTVRAWGYLTTSWNITHGFVETWDDLAYIMNRTFRNTKGDEFQIAVCMIDSGDQTDVVYDFCAQNYEWAKPCKGSSRPLPTRYNISQIDKTGSKADGLSLYICDGDKYKDSIAGRLQRENGTGSWMVHKNCDQDYANQICSEQKIKERKGSTYIFKWKPKAGSPNNHYLDCEVYAYLGADLNLVRYIGMENIEKNQESKIQEQQDNYQNNWLSTKNWLNPKGNWLR